MKGIRTKLRVDWVRAGLGKGKKYTEKNFHRARRRLLERGVILVVNSVGPAYEKIAAVRQNSPVAMLAESHNAGERWFPVEQIERAIGNSVFSREGLIRLASLGLVVTRQIGDRLELVPFPTRFYDFFLA